MHPHPAPLALHPPGHVLKHLPSPQLPAHHHRRSRTDARPDRRDLAAAAGHRCHRIGHHAADSASARRFLLHRRVLLAHHSRSAARPLHPALSLLLSFPVRLSFHLSVVPTSFLLSLILISFSFFFFF